jgi:signal peptide peptidase SppA
LRGIPQASRAALKLPDLISAPWAIQPEKLSEILAIYATHFRGENIDKSQVEARLGRPLANEQQEYRIREGGIAVLPIDGVLAPKANLFTQISGGASASMLDTQVQSAIADPRVKALVLAIDSPGGSVFGSPELAATIRTLSAEKPIIAVGEGMMASAAYWIASSANAVFLSGPTVHAGSIGVVMAHEFDPRAHPAGGKTTEITAGRYKRIASDKAPLTEEGRAYLQERVDHLYSVFVDAVADNRGVTAQQVLAQMADGRVFVGQQAIDAGLADGFMTVDAAVEQLAQDTTSYSKRRRAKPMAAARVQPIVTPAGAVKMDRTQLETEHPALFAQLRAEFSAEGAEAERTRIQNVEAAALPGHEALIAALKFDGKTSGGDAAMAVNSAERALRNKAAATLSSEAPNPLKPAAAPTVETGEPDPMADQSKPIEERCKAKWDSDAATRAEFTNLAAFTGWAKAHASGKVRVLTTRAAA